MRVFNSIEELPEFSGTVFTQGTFDGVHLGHRQILNTLRDEAHRTGSESILLTFWPHPRLLLYPDDNQLKLLQTLEEKLEVLADCGVDNVAVLPFTRHFSNMLPEDYIKELLVNKLCIRTAIVGYDHRFGRNREGDIQLLRTYAPIYHYNVTEIAAEDVDHITISSTKIRHALLSGDVETANAYLGRPYNFKGTVVHGKKLGRELGYPTANIEIAERFKLIPANGVYAVSCAFEGKVYNGMMNIGVNPSIAGKGFSIEVHLFEFEGDLYGKQLDVKVLARLRNEKKFSDLKELAQFLHNDKLHALKKIASL